MKKIYVVTSGEYSDYCINAVFESREKAELYCAIQNASEAHRYSYDRCEIEEYELSDDNLAGNVDKWYCFYIRKYTGSSPAVKVKYSVNDSYVTAEKLESEIEDVFSDQLIIRVCIKENDTDKAIKIARDLVAKYDAKKAGL